MGSTPPLLRFEEQGQAARGPTGIQAPPLQAKVDTPIELKIWITDDAVHDKEPIKFGRERPGMNVTWFKHTGPGAVEFDPQKAGFPDPERSIRHQGHLQGARRVRRAGQGRRLRILRFLGRQPVLLDQRLPAGHGHQVAVTRRLVLAVALVGLATRPDAGEARQEATAAEHRVATFARDYSELNALLIGAERAHGVLYGALARGRGKVHEAETFRLMNRRTAVPAVAAGPDPESDAGYARLGPRGAEVVRRTQAFHREALAILATVDKADRARALDEAVDRYLSRPAVALPDVPKDMTILYDHPYTSIVVDVPGAPRRKTPRLRGFVWATHWLQLAAEEPLDLSADAETRRRDLLIVMERFRRKLDYGKAPNAFPGELPLAPSIAPELVTTHARTAAIIDNLNMMHAVLEDVLEHPKVANVPAAVDEVIEHFTDRTYRVVEVDNWIRMALRHSIFEQGGPAIGVMTVSDRNGSGHLQHLNGGRGILPGMK